MGEFEGSVLKILNKPPACLDRKHDDLRNKIQFYPWSHRKEKETFFPITDCY